MLVTRRAGALAFAAALLAGCGDTQPPPHLRVAGGEPGRGVAAIRAHGCGACHTIPGVRGAKGVVGPPLERFAARSHVAGILPNRPLNLVRWIRDPPSVSPMTAMPRLGVDEQEARDIAAYLYTLGAREAAVYPPPPWLPLALPPERRLLETREVERLETYGWVDRGRGIARIPIGRAMELIATEPAGSGEAGRAPRVGEQ